MIPQRMALSEHHGQVLHPRLGISWVSLPTLLCMNNMLLQEASDDPLSGVPRWTVPPWPLTFALPSPIVPSRRTCNRLMGVSEELVCTLVDAAAVTDAALPADAARLPPHAAAPTMVTSVIDDTGKTRT